jgi:hypothetical protein
MESNSLAAFHRQHVLIANVSEVGEEESPEPKNARMEGAAGPCAKNAYVTFEAEPAPLSAKP